MDAEFASLLISMRSNPAAFADVVESQRLGFYDDEDNSLIIPDLSIVTDTSEGRRGCVELIDFLRNALLPCDSVSVSEKLCEICNTVLANTASSSSSCEQVLLEQSDSISVSGLQELKIRVASSSASALHMLIDCLIDDGDENRTRRHVLCDESALVFGVATTSSANDDDDDDNTTTTTTLLVASATRCVPIASAIEAELAELVAEIENEESQIDVRILDEDDVPTNHQFNDERSSSSSSSSSLDDFLENFDDEAEGDTAAPTTTSSDALWKSAQVSTTDLFNDNNNNNNNNTTSSSSLQQQKMYSYQHRDSMVSAKNSTGNLLAMSACAEFTETNDENNNNNNDDDDDDDDEDDDNPLPPPPADSSSLSSSSSAAAAAVVNNNKIESQPSTTTTTTTTTTVAATPSVVDYQVQMIGIAKNESISASLRARAASMEALIEVRDVEHDLQLLGVVGKGAFGAVYRAEHIATKRIVAAKRLHHKTEAELQLITNETLLVRACRSAFVVAYCGEAESRGARWIFMEFCPSSVSDVIDHYRAKQLRFDEIELRTIMRCLLHALAFIHKLDVIHRDVKADNLLINERAVPKLADFGVSGQQQSPLTSMVGTPAFIAPEVVAAGDGVGAAYNEKVDIWAAGVTLIQCADLIEPYAGQNPFRVLFKIPTAPSPTLAIPETRSDKLNECIALCLRKQPAERPSAAWLLRRCRFLEPLSEYDRVKPTIEYTAADETTRNSFDDVLAETDARDEMMSLRMALDRILAARASATNDRTNVVDDFDDEVMPDKETAKERINAAIENDIISPRMTSKDESRSKRTNDESTSTTTKNRGSATSKSMTSKVPSEKLRASGRTNARDSSHASADARSTAEVKALIREKKKRRLEQYELEKLKRQQQEQKDVKSSEREQPLKSSSQELKRSGRLNDSSSSTSNTTAASTSSSGSRVSRSKKPNNSDGNSKPTITTDDAPVAPPPLSSNTINALLKKERSGRTPIDELIPERDDSRRTRKSEDIVSVDDRDELLAARRSRRSNTTTGPPPPQEIQSLSIPASRPSTRAPTPANSSTTTSSTSTTNASLNTLTSPRTPAPTPSGAASKSATNLRQSPTRTPAVASSSNSARSSSSSSATSTTSTNPNASSLNSIMQSSFQQQSKLSTLERVGTLPRVNAAYSRKVFGVLARADYVGTDDELSFEKGDRIIILEQDGGGWARGYVVDERNAEPNDVIDETGFSFRHARVSDEDNIIGWFPLKAIEKQHQQQMLRYSTTQPKAITPQSSSITLNNSSVGRISIATQTTLQGLIAPLVAQKQQRSTAKKSAASHHHSTSSTSSTSSSNIAPQSPVPSRTQRPIGAAPLPTKKKDASSTSSQPPPPLPASLPSNTSKATPSTLNRAANSTRPTTTTLTSSTSTSTNALNTATKNATTSGVSTTPPLPTSSPPPTSVSTSTSTTSTTNNNNNEDLSTGRLLVGGEFDMLLFAMTRRDGGLKIGKQSRRFKTFEDCVSGSHVVEWLLSRIALPLIQSKEGAKKFALRLAQDIVRRKALIDVDEEDNDDGSSGSAASDSSAVGSVGSGIGPRETMATFNVKALYRVALHDSSLPLNSPRLCDQSDLAWGRQCATNEADSLRTLQTLSSVLFAKRGTMATTVLAYFHPSHYIDSSIKTVPRALAMLPIALSQRTLDDLCDLVQQSTNNASASMPTTLLVTPSIASSTSTSSSTASTSTSSVAISALAQLALSDAFAAWSLRTSMLQLTPLQTLVDDTSRLVYFCNLHNAMMLHGQILGISTAITQPVAAKGATSIVNNLQATLTAINSTIRYLCDRATYSIDDIHHGILRSQANQLRFLADKRKRLHALKHRDPLVNLVLSRGLMSCSPPLLALTSSNAATALLLVAQAFAHDNIRVDRKNKEILLPEWLQPLIEDFGENRVEQLKSLSRLLPRNVKAFVVMHSRALEIRWSNTVHLAPIDAMNLYAAWYPRDVSGFVDAN